MANPSQNNPKEGAATTPNSTPDPASFQSVVPRIIEEEMKSSYLDYAMSVIVGRALPDVRDGLKPVHRRILFAMHEMGMSHNKPFKKSARIVGDTLGRYHPHGDTAVYDALVRLAQQFSMRYPLIQGQGNFGSVDGDNAAAMRYCVGTDTRIVTEHGLVKIGSLSPTENISIQILSKDKKVNNASKWFDSGIHETLKVTTYKGYSLTGTKNHPILTFAKDEFGRPIFQWKLFEEIEEGDIAVLDRAPDSFWPLQPCDVTRYYPTVSSRTKIRKLPSFFDENLAFVLGAFIAEGSISENKIEFCNSDKEWIDAFCTVWKIIFPDSTLHLFKKKPVSYGKKECYRLECHCRYPITFLRNLGLEPVRSAQKRVPDIIFQSPKHVVAAFLKNYFEGDGSISYSRKMVELSCCSVSEQLINDLQTLLLRFGIDTFKRYDHHRTIWKLYLRGRSNYLRFYKEIGFLSEHKNRKLEYVLVTYTKEASQYDAVPFISEYLRDQSASPVVSKYNFDRYGGMEKNYAQVTSAVIGETGIDYSSLFEYLLQYRYLFDTIVRIEQAPPQPVFSIKVESQCHSFISNGFISHNTEARLAKIAEEILVDLDKETVDFVPNFDGSLKEPAVLPSKIPNLLINGSSGIAVGMATNIPPHNAAEIIDGTVSLIDHPESGVDDLLKYIKGPDFPTAAIISGTGEMRRAYVTGQGKVLVKAKAIIEPHKDRERIIVTEIPYQLNKASLLEQIAELIRDKKITGISDLRDESDRDGMRVVIELKKDANSSVVLNQLYTYTRLTQTFGMNMLALVDNEPKLLSLKELLQHFISHRQVVVRKRTMFELKKADERSHILEGLIIALNNIDAVIQKIKKSATVETAKAMLMDDYSLSELQAKSILDMRLQKLSSLEQEKIRDEHKQLLVLIKELKDILASEQRILGIIKQELLELKKQYGDERKTVIEYTEGDDEELVTEDLIKEEPMVVTISRSGYIKRLPLTTYRQQGRGGTGVKGAGTKEDDDIEHLFVASTHAYLLFFTNKGKVYWQKVYQIPEAGRQAKGRAIVNFIQLSPGELVQAVVPVKEFNNTHYLFLATRKGTVKKTELEAYSRPRQGGIIAVTLDESDELVNARITSGNDQIILATKQGMAVRFHEENVRPMGRGATGVRGITLKGDDVVIAMVIADDNQDLLTITEHGYGKRTLVSEYRLINRGGSGVINIQCTERNGNVVSVCSITEEDEIMLISKDGIIIRMGCKGISQIGRNTQGVRVMKLHEGDKVVAATRVIGEKQELV